MLDKMKEFRKTIIKLMGMLPIIVLSVQVVDAQTYTTLRYHEYAFLELPDPPYDGYINSAVWNRTSGNIVFDKTSEVGATIYLDHYFEGTELVTCDYTFTYIGNYDGHYHAGRGSHTFVISFASGTAEISDDVLSLRVGKSKKLSCRISTGGYGNPEPEWTSSNEAIASVSSLGVVTANAVGDAYIIVDPIVCAPLRCHVLVEPAIPPTGLIIEPDHVIVKEGDSQTLSCRFTPEGAYSDVEWSSSDESIATVSSSGKVTGKKEGQTTVIAKTENGKTASVSVTVTPQPKAVSVDDICVYVGYPVKLTATVDPPVETSLSWKVSDAAVASVSDGMLTGLKVGEAEITVTTSNNVSGKAKVKVVAVPKGMAVAEVRAKMSVMKALTKKSFDNLKKSK